MATSSYTDTRLLINNEWCDAASGKTLDVINPGHRQADRQGGPRRHRRSGPRARRRAEAASKPGARSRPTSAPRPCARPRHWCANARPTSRRLMTQEQGKPFAEARVEVLAAADIIEWFADEGRRVYGRDRAVAQSGRAATGAQGADRPGRRVHAVEFPGQPGRAQAERRARERLLVPRQGAGRNPGVAGRAAAGVRRSRRAGRHGRSRVRRSGRDFQLPDSASGDPQGHVHRLDAGRQATGRAGRRST